MSARKLADMRDRLILIAAPRGMGRTIVVQFYVAIYADSKGLHQWFKLHPSTVPLSRGWYPVATLGFPTCTPADQVHPNHTSQCVCGSGYSRTVLAVRHSPSVVRLCTSEPIASFLSFQAPQLSIRMHFPTQTHQRTPRIRTRAFILQEGVPPPALLCHQKQWNVLIYKYR
jgi:hypothetical protein